MSSNINGNTLTLEEKVLRAFQSGCTELEDKSDEEIRKHLDKLRPSILLGYISNALEEMFEPVGK